MAAQRWRGATSRLTALLCCRAWLRAAGTDVSDDARVEISPLFALDAPELKAKIGGVKVQPDMCLD